MRGLPFPPALGAVALLLVLVGCGSPYAIRHRVSPSEDLATVARQYGISESELRDFNRLTPEDQLRPGDIVFIPGAREAMAQPQPPSPYAAPPPAASHAVPSPTVQSAPLPVSTRASSPRASPARVGTEGAPPGGESLQRDSSLRWPVDGTILRGYGSGPAGESRGIDIGVPKGSRVVSAGPGRVTYAGTPARAYGPVVILEHPGDLYTVYGNLDGVQVQRGDEVKAGQILGSTGGAEGALPPHLHFEVRQRERPADPLLYLPAP